VAVPAGTEPFFAQATAGWQDRTTYNAFMYGDKHFLPLRDIPVAKVLNAGETFEWQDIRLRILATPGHTDQHLAFVMEQAGKKFIFSGDIISAPGQVWEMDALQGSYEEFIQSEPTLKGIPNLRKSIQALVQEEAAMLLPAHGEPMEQCREALTLLDQNLVEMMTVLNGIKYFGGGASEVIPEVQTMQTCCCQYLIEEEGNGFLFDCGIDVWNQADGSQISFLDWLKAHPTLKTVEHISPSHYHLDHIATVRGVVAHYQAQVHTHEILADILQRPERYHRPCLTRLAIRVDHQYKEGESFEWRGWHMTFYHFPGQTHWHQAMLAEKNGKKILFTGDSVDDYGHIRNIDCWNYTEISETEGAARCLAILEKTQPDYLATGHWGIHSWKPENNGQIREYIRKRNEILTRLIGRKEPNLGYDVHWAELEPFRTVIQIGKKVSLIARVHNHLNEEALCTVSLSLPGGWLAQTAAGEIKVAPRADGSVTFEVTVPEEVKAQRYPIGLEVVLNGEPMGELGLAFIDVGQTWDIENRDPARFPCNTDDYGFFTKA
jgi:glyoxylase-like metal-dependent hydrolase (beta-lactamase superfamily II)